MLLSLLLLIFGRGNKYTKQAYILSL